MIEFTDTSLRDVLDFLGRGLRHQRALRPGLRGPDAVGDAGGVTFEEALSRILAANGAFHKGCHDSRLSPLNIELHREHCRAA